MKVGADERGQNVTEFAIECAYSEAQQTLADRQHFILTPEKWDAFMVALDKPPRLNPRLKRLFAEPSILVRSGRPE